MEKFGNVLLDYLSKRHHELSGEREKNFTKCWMIYILYGAESDITQCRAHLALKYHLQY